jgi:hypothetical protein
VSIGICDSVPYTADVLSSNNESAGAFAIFELIVIFSSTSNVIFKFIILFVFCKIHKLCTQTKITLVQGYLSVDYSNRRPLSYTIKNIYIYIKQIK